MAEKYETALVEAKWQKFWKDEKVCRFDPSDKTRPVFSIDNPPRYASGALHMGHAVNYSQIDFVARYKRMRGYNVLFPLCFDTNGTPIEVKVEKKHGITLDSVDRHEFIRLCREFANSHIEEMTRQFEVLGESMDPDLYYQTDADYYRRTTQISFLKMYHKGLIYKGVFPVNWCPRCGTSVAEAEVEYQSRSTLLNYIHFETRDREKIPIATTRPELLCTCQMVAVHPEDQEKSNIVGKELKTPLFDKWVEVCEDDSVDPDFGTGVVMVCTIGDKDDLGWVHKYDLPLDMGIDESGHMTDIAGAYRGMSIVEAREKVLEDLSSSGLLIKQEPVEQNVGACWRCQTPIEFLVVPQWFLKTLDFKNDILRMAEEIDWFPPYMRQRLEDWTNSLAWDWPISRKRFFATPLPLWECVECEDVVVAREEDCYTDPTLHSPPVDSCNKCGGALKGCEDVFDTWMDSSISALYVAGWQRDEELFSRLYPISLRPQAQDIIRTWAFYTMLRSHLLLEKKPWEQVMIGAYILSPDGTPMHASKGNAVDPVDLLNEYGADPIRYYAATCGLGEDSPVRYKDLVRGRKLVTKFWNVERFISGCVDLSSAPTVPPNALRDVDRWILSRYSAMLEDVTCAMEEYAFDVAVRRAEAFLWGELADHYIEMVKHREEDDAGLGYVLYTVGLGIAKVFAPFMPHVTEDVYQNYYRRGDGPGSIHESPWPVPSEAGEERPGSIIKDVVAAVRNRKSERGMPLNAPISWLGVVLPENDAGLDMEDVNKTLKVGTIEKVDKTSLVENVVGAKPNKSRIGPEFKSLASKISNYLSNAAPEELRDMYESQGKTIYVDGQEAFIGPEHFSLVTSLSYMGEEVEIVQAGEAVVLLRTSNEDGGK